jgi:cytochrome c556
MSKGVSIGVLLAAGLLGSVGVLAQGADNRGAQWIKYRQSIYTVLGTNFGQLGAVVQNKAPFDAADFARRADRVAFMAGIAPEAFPAESASGAPTKA